MQNKIRLTKIEKEKKNVTYFSFLCPHSRNQLGDQPACCLSLAASLNLLISVQ